MRILKERVVLMLGSRNASFSGFYKRPRVFMYSAKENLTPLYYDYNFFDQKLLSNTFQLQDQSQVLTNGI